MDKNIAETVATAQPGDAPTNYPYSPREPTLPPPDPPWELPRLAIPFPILPVSLAVIFAISNFALLPLTSLFDQNDYGAVWVYFTAGVVLAQGGLLAAVLVFGTGEFVRRLALCWAAAIPLWLCWAGGLVLNNTRAYRQDSAADLRFGLLVMPLAAIAIQAPLWFFRLYLGWRLIRADTSGNLPRHLSIRDYLTGTAIAAFSITCARLALKPSEIDPDYWAGWSMFIASAAGISLASVVPAILLMFRCRHWAFGMAMLDLYSGAAIFLISGLLAICSLRFPGVVPQPESWASLGIAILFMSFAAFLGLGLKALRDMDFTLQLKRTKV
jgi:hypothetical protein